MSEKNELEDLKTVAKRILGNPEKIYEYNGIKASAWDAIVLAVIVKAIEGDMRAVYWLTKAGGLDEPTSILGY